ncbi:MAG: hypothetical protein NTY87_09160 [Planctomycetia bacterium]|nr:hypothetical protein [Planctomycetia bacterium]
MNSVSPISAPQTVHSTFVGMALTRVDVLLCVVPIAVFLSIVSLV